MAKVVKESDLGEVPAAVSVGRYYVYCPGCFAMAQAQYPHEPRYWMLCAIHCFSDKVHQFNGNLDAPTLSPSLLVTGKQDANSNPWRCHSFVNDGKIQFLGDCTHPLANQTVDLLDVPPRERD